MRESADQSATPNESAAASDGGRGPLAKLDPCDLLTVEAATEVLGSGVKGPKTEEYTGSGATSGDDFVGCAYTSRGPGKQSALRLIFHLRSVTREEFSDRKNAVAREPVAGVGDMAFASTKDGAYLDVLDGDARFLVDYFRVGAQKEGFYESMLEKLKSIAAAAIEAI